MTGEIAEIKIHLFENGMFVECEDTGDGRFIPKHDLKPLVDLINEVESSLTGVFTLTEYGKQYLANEGNSK